MSRLFTEIMELTRMPAGYSAGDLPAVVDDPVFPRSAPAVHQLQPKDCRSASRGSSRLSRTKGLRGDNDQWRSHLGLHADGKLYWTDPDLAVSAGHGGAGGALILLVEQPDGTLKRVDDPFQWRPPLDPGARAGRLAIEMVGLRRSRLCRSCFATLRSNQDQADTARCATAARTA